MLHNIIIGVPITSALSSATLLGSRQAQSIEQTVAATNETTISIMWFERHPPVPLVKLAGTADLIIDCQLVRTGSYISEDKTRIYTDYQVIPNRIIRSRVGDAGATPGVRPPMVVSLLGGEIVLNGKTVRFADPSLKAIKSGGRFLLFATAVGQEENRFSATAGGAIEVDNPEYCSEWRSRQIVEFSR